MPRRFFCPLRSDANTLLFLSDLRSDAGVNAFAVFFGKFEGVLGAVCRCFEKADLDFDVGGECAPCRDLGVLRLDLWSRALLWGEETGELVEEEEEVKAAPRGFLVLFEPTLGLLLRSLLLLLRLLLLLFACPRDAGDDTAASLLFERRFLLPEYGVLLFLVCERSSS